MRRTEREREVKVYQLSDMSLSKAQTKKSKQIASQELSPFQQSTLQTEHH